MFNNILILFEAYQTIKLFKTASRYYDITRLHTKHDFQSGINKEKMDLAISEKRLDLIRHFSTIPVLTFILGFFKNQLIAYINYTYYCYIVCFAIGIYFFMFIAAYDIYKLHYRFLIKLQNNYNRFLRHK